MAKKEKSLLRQLIDERGIKDVAGVQDLVKELTAGLIQEIRCIFQDRIFWPYYRNACNAGNLASSLF